MSKADKIAAQMEPARIYVKQQLETMKKQGVVSELTTTQYDSLVLKVAMAASR